MALEKTDKQREIYWGGIDNTIVPTMAKAKEETAKEKSIYYGRSVKQIQQMEKGLTRLEAVSIRLLNIDEEISAAKDKAANGTKKEIAEYQRLKKEKKKLMKEEAEHAKKMAKEEGKIYTLKSLQADLEEKIGKMKRADGEVTTKLTSNLYLQGIAQRKFLMDRLQIVSTGQTLNTWAADLADLIEKGSESQKKWAQAMTPLVSLGGELNSQAQQLGTAYDDIGTGAFNDMTASQDKQLKNAERYQQYVTGEVLPALKVEQDILEEDISKLMSKGKLTKAEKKELEEKKKLLDENLTQAEKSEQLAKENVDHAKNLSEEAKRQKVLNDQVASSAAFIVAPFEKVQSILESNMVGKFASSIIGVDGIMKEFSEKVTGSLKAAFDPDNPLHFSMAVRNIKASGKKAAKALEEGFTAAGKVFGTINKSMGGMLGPALAIVAVLMIAKKVAEMFYGGMAETRKEFGLTFTEAAGLQQILNTTAMEMKFLGVSAEDVKAGAVGIMDNLGGIGQITQSNVKEMARLNAMYGIGGESAGVLAGQMMAVGASSIDAVGAQLDSVAALSQANGVAPAVIMEDVANSSEAFAGFAKDGGQNVFKAAIAARKLGLSMSTVESIADSLLDFESSINSQMEASMLLGRNINTDKARELALAGDLEGMQREITKQIGSASDWNALNIVQRKSLAAAFGMEVSEMGKMITNQDKINNMTTAQKKRQDLIADVMKKIGEIWTRFLGIFKALLPLAIGLLSPFLAIAGVLIVILGYFADFIEWLNEANVMGVGLGDVIMFAAGAALLFRTNLMGGGIMGFLKGTKDMVMSIGSSMTGVAKKMMGMGGDGVPLTKSGKPDKRFGKRADKTKSVKKPAPGKGKKGGGMMETMFGKDSKISFKKMLKGAGAMLVVSVALFIMAKALQEFGDVSWESIAMAGVTLLGLTIILAILGKLQGQLIQGALAMLIMSVGLIPFAFALQMLSAVDYGKVALAGVTLIGLTAAMFLLGALLAGPGAIIFGAGVIGMIALGGALIILGVGLMAVGQGMKIIGSIVEPLTQLVSIVAPLFKLSTAFAALGYSMGVMALGALTLLPALPVLMTLAALGMMGGAVLGIGGKGAETGGAESNPVELKLETTNAKLDTLISLMSEDGFMVENLKGIKKNTGTFAGSVI